MEELKCDPGAAFTLLARMRAEDLPFPPVAVEVFSGSGRWAAAMRSRNFYVIECDIRDKIDCSSTGFKKLIVGAMRNQLIDAIHFGTPCASFSRARERPNGPPPLRSNAHIWGLPHLTGKDADKVFRGNLCAKATITLARTALRLGIPGSFENPSRSRIFMLPIFSSFMSQKLVRRTTLDFCAFGTPWRKRTVVLSWFIDNTLFERRCCTKNGLCDFSHKPHQILEGVDPVSRRFRTSIAEPYPKALCRQWSLAFKNAWAARVIGNSCKACWSRPDPTQI